MTVYYSKGGANDTSYLRFETPANWNTQTDGGGTDASSTSDLNGAHLVIQSGDYMDMGADVSCLSLTTLSGSHLKGPASGSYTVTVTGKGTSSEPAGGGSEDYSIQFDGELDSDNNTNFKVTTASANNIDLLPSNTNYPRNLTIHHASCVSTIQAQLVVKDKINIIEGELNTEGHLVNSGEANLEISTNASAKLTFGANNVLCGRLGESNGAVGKVNQTQSAGSAGKIRAEKTGNLRIIDMGNSAIFTGAVIIEYNGDQSSGSASQDMRAASGTYDLIVNCKATTDTMLFNASPTGLNDVTITKGILDPNSSALTVAGKTTIGNASYSSEDQAKLNCGSSTISLGSGKTDGYAIVMLAGGTFAGGSANHTTGAIKQTVANTKFTFTSATTTINSEYTSDDRMFELTNGKAFNADGRITFTGNFTSCIQWTGPSGDTGPHNVRLNDVNLTLKPRNALNVEGYMAIDAGTFNTQYDGSDKNLTVTGYCDVTGGLTLNNSTVSVAALRTQSGAVMTQGSTGALTLAVASNFGGTEGASYSWRNEDGTSDINLAGTLTVSASGFFEPRTAPDNASVINNLVWDASYYWVGNMTIGGTLVVNASKHLQPYGGSKDIVVNGDVTLNGQLTAHPNAHAELDNMTFGSLTIGGSGAYHATNGTTTITDENTSNYAIQNNGTFTHNGGTVSIETADHTSLAWSSASQRFNNLTINLGASGRAFTQASGFGDTDNKYIEGALQIINSTYNVNNQELRVDGDVSLSTNAVLNGAAGDVKFGSFTINSGTTYNATSGTTTITGESSTGDSANFAWYNAETDGTGFAHNNGKVVIDTAGNNHTTVKETTFYDLEVNMTNSTREAKFRPSSGTHSDILNNFTLTQGIYEMHADGDTLDIHGLTTIEANGQFLKDAEHTGLVTHHGLVTNRGAYMLKDGVTVKMNGGIRQLNAFTTP